VADRFVRVRLTRIDNLDLSLFEFDYDVTMMIFFLNAEEKIYARYGGRDATNADARQSLEGLRYTMQSVLAMHQQKEPEFAPRTKGAPTSARTGFGGKGCMHCHQVRERLNEQTKRDGKWDREMFYRFPLPENLGFALEVNRGNLVKSVKEKSPAADAGLKVGDVVQRLGNVPVHSFGDATFALDHAPKLGALDITWRREGEIMASKLNLVEGWRKSDLTWRASMRRFIPSVKLNGTELTMEERKALELTDKQLAFRQRDAISLQAQVAGIRPGDIILGVDDVKLDVGITDFHFYVERNYLMGDRPTVNLLRDGKRMNIPMTLTR